MLLLRHIRCLRRHSSMAPELENRRIQEERMWIQLFNEPFMWFDNRSSKQRDNCPDFKNVVTGENLWTGSWYCPRWVHSRLKLLKDPDPRARSIRAEYRGTSALSFPEETPSENQQENLKDIPALLDSLRACSVSRDLKVGREIHADAKKSRLDSNIYVANSLVNMYAKCGSLDDAKTIFDRMKSRTVVSWNAMILGYAANEGFELALQLYEAMESEGCAPNERTYTAALMACSNLAAKEDGKDVQGKLVKLDFLEKGMAIHSQAARNGFTSNIFVANSLINMYANCRSLLDARMVFDRMLCHDVVSWTSMIVGYVGNEEAELALKLYQKMETEGCKRDAQTFAAALVACSSLAALETGRQIHEEICKSGFQEDTFLSNCLLDFYCKCGSVADAVKIFRTMCSRNLVTWSALIAGYARIGDAASVFDLFEEMREEGQHPDGVIFLSLLSACSHAGTVEKAKDHFQAMVSQYGLTPGIEHYHCMVDVLGRGNHLEEAVAMVRTMPYRPTVVTWNTILAACWKWKNLKVGRLAFEESLKLDKLQGPAYVLMANIYRDAGMEEEQSKVLCMRSDACDGS